MKILGVSTSFRKASNTEILLREALTCAESEGAEVEYLSVISKDIKPCEGCLSCTKTGKCQINDGMQEIYPKLIAADGIILGTPVFFWSVSGMAKVFIDRTFALRFPSLQLANKVGGVIIVASRTGLMNAVEVINQFFQSNHMLVTDAVTGLGRAPGTVRKDKFAMKQAYELGKQMVALIKTGYQFPPDWDCPFNTFIERKYGTKSSPFE